MSSQKGNKAASLPTIMLSADNLTKFPMEILYLKEQGHTEFVVEYDFDHVKLPLTRIAEKIKGPLFKTIQNYDIVVHVKGFPRSVFERVLLKPYQRWYFEKNIKYIPPKLTSEFNKELEVRNEYVEQFGESELEPLVSNKELAEEYEEVFKFMKHPEIKSYAKKVLQDYKKDPYHMRKRIVFVESVPRDLEESYHERFVYYIYNRKDDFDKTMKLAYSFFSKEEIGKFEHFLPFSNEIVFSFAQMSSGALRKTFYFHVRDFTQEQLHELKHLLDVPFEHNMEVGGVGIDFTEGRITTKVYYIYDSIKKEDIKMFFGQFPLECKRKLFNVLNSCTKPLKHVLLDFKYREGKLVSKRVDLSMQFNSFKLHQLTHLLDTHMGFLQGMDPYTLSFEVTVDCDEKINFYFALKKQPEEEELEEEAQLQ